ncbi:MAG TPA: hypothetical protein VNB24_00770 [Acidimicrobiales bacterium]|nr:hypothetical protein [Acidimicrobiales bacterium]
MLAYVPDLMDRSRLAALGNSLEFVTSFEGFSEAGRGDIVIVDLGRPGALDAAGAAAARGARVVGFASHVDDALMSAAKGAGIEAHPRSRFFNHATELLGA